MFYESPEHTSTSSPTGPKISPRSRTGPTGPKIPQGSGGGGKISLPVGILFIVIAGVIDLMQFLLELVPFAGWLASTILSICATFFFGIGFYHHGINLFSSRMALGTISALVAELAPFINGLPWLTARVTTAVLLDWRKEGAV